MYREYFRDITSGFEIRKGSPQFCGHPSWSDLKRGQVDHYESFVVTHYPKSVVRKNFVRSQNNTIRSFGSVDEFRRHSPTQNDEPKLDHPPLG